LDQGVQEMENSGKRTQGLRPILSPRRKQQQSINSAASASMRAAALGTATGGNTAPQPTGQDGAGGEHDMTKKTRGAKFTADLPEGPTSPSSAQNGVRSPERRTIRFSSRTRTQSTADTGTEARTRSISRHFGMKKKSSDDPDRGKQDVVETSDVERAASSEADGENMTREATTRKEESSPSGVTSMLRSKSHNFFRRHKTGGGRVGSVSSKATATDECDERSNPSVSESAVFTATRTTEPKASAMSPPRLELSPKQQRQRNVNFEILGGLSPKADGDRLTRKTSGPDADDAASPGRRLGKREKSLKVSMSSRWALTRAESKGDGILAAFGRSSDSVDDNAGTSDLQSSEDPEGYELLDTVLGEGMFSEVILGRRLVDDAPVAVKRIKRKGLFNRDAAFTLKHETLFFRAGLCHENIVDCLSVQNRGKSSLVVMEYVPGGTLKNLVDRHPLYSDSPLSFRVRKQVFRQMLAALTYLHANCVIHRDIKPENILLDYGGSTTSSVEPPPPDKELSDAIPVAMLADFGLCKVLESVGSTTNGKYGSPLYVAPEVISYLDYGSEVDVWSLGVVMYFVFAGNDLFDGNSSEEVVEKVKTATIDLGAVRSRGARAVLAKMIDRNQRTRISAADALDLPFFALDDDNVSDETDEIVADASNTQTAPGATSFTTNVLSPRSGVYFCDAMDPALAVTAATSHDSASSHPRSTANVLSPSHVDGEPKSSKSAEPKSTKSNGAGTTSASLRAALIG